MLGTYGKELPENTLDTEAGTIVKLPNEWYSTTENEKIANVYAVSDGKGNTIPVPYGFYYVGGTLDSGVVISDHQSDKNKYKGIGDVPTGVAYHLDGTVNKEKCDLQGNQFVWIPCKSEDYKKIDFGADYKNSVDWDRTTNTAEKAKVEKYGGFFVGRYEAGTSEIILANNVKFEDTSKTTIITTTINQYGWQNGDFVSSKVSCGKITSKAGEIPYYHADYITAVEMSERMYQTDYVQSGLMTGTMWDMMMRFITTDNINYSDLKDTLWGNYRDNETIVYTAGKGRYLSVNVEDGAITAKAIVADNGYHYGIRTTASSEGVKKKNLYDLAGNLWEWTTESAYINSSNSENKIYHIRGGTFGGSYTVGPVCFRGYSLASLTTTDRGFRPVIYIK